MPAPYTSQKKKKAIPNAAVVRKQNETGVPHYTISTLPELQVLD